jgi:hypothetical protein
VPGLCPHHVGAISIVLCQWNGVVLGNGDLLHPFSLTAESKNVGLNEPRRLARKIIDLAAARLHRRLLQRKPQPVSSTRGQKVRALQKVYSKSCANKFIL